MNDDMLSNYFVGQSNDDETVLYDSKHRLVYIWTFHYEPTLAEIVTKAREDADEQITAAIDEAVERSNFAADADERDDYTDLAERWDSASATVRAFEHHWPADCLAEAAEFARALSRTPDADLAAAKELESAAEDYSAAYQKVSANGMQEVYDFLYARAARLREQGGE